MLKYRLVTGPILIAVLLGIVIVDDHLDTVTLGAGLQDLLGREHPPRGLLLFIVGLVVAALGALEFSRIVDANGIRTSPWLTALGAMTGLTLSYVMKLDASAIHVVAALSTGLVVLLVGSLLYFSRGQTVEGVLAASGAVMFVTVYLGLMFGFLIAMRRDHSAWIIVGVLMTTKACDTGAYFTGRAIGRHKLIPWLSPGKTWEGLAGGVVTAMLVGLGLSFASGLLGDPGDHVPPWLGLACGFAFAIVGQFGDLTMSLFKRGAGIKDSSQLLPGLGGVLDVLDSPLMVAPVAFWMLAPLGN